MKCGIRRRHMLVNIRWRWIKHTLTSNSVFHSRELAYRHTSTSNSTFESREPTSKVENQPASLSTSNFISHSQILVSKLNLTLNAIFQSQELVYKSSLTSNPSSQSRKQIHKTTSTSDSTFTIKNKFRGVIWLWIPPFRAEKLWELVYDPRLTLNSIFQRRQLVYKPISIVNPLPTFRSRELVYKHSLTSNPIPHNGMLV